MDDTRTLLNTPMGRRRLLGLVAGGAVAGILAACGTDAAPTTAAGSSGAAGGTARPTSQGQVVIATTAPTAAAMSAATAAPASSAATASGMSVTMTRPELKGTISLARQFDPPLSGGKPDPRTTVFKDLLTQYQKDHPGVTVEFERDSRLVCHGDLPVGRHALRRKEYAHRGRHLPGADDHRCARGEQHRAVGEPDAHTRCALGLLRSGVEERLRRRSVHLHEVRPQEQLLRPLHPVQVRVDVQQRPLEESGPHRRRRTEDVEAMVRCVRQAESGGRDPHRARRLGTGTVTHRVDSLHRPRSQAVGQHQRGQSLPDVAAKSSTRSARTSGRSTRRGAASGGSN